MAHAARSPTCCCRRSGRRATARGGASAATARAPGSSASSASLVGGAIFGGRVLADGAARRLRRVRRLPAAARPVVAVPDVPLVPRLQRHRHRAVDVLPLGRPAAAAGGAGRGAAAVPRALPAHGRRSRPGWSSCSSSPCWSASALAHCAPAVYYPIAVAGGDAVRRSSRSRSGRRSRCCSSTSSRRGARATS